MPINNDGSRGTGTGMNSKQKLIIIIIVIALMVVIWQVMEIMGDGSSSAPTPATITPAKTTAMNASSPQGAPGKPNMNTPAPAPGDINQQEDLTPRQASVAGNMSLIQVQQEAQAKYIASLNQLQMLKIQREIAETNQAITASKLATVTAEQNIADLLVKPAPVSLPASAYANNLVNAAMSGQAINGGPIGSPPAGIPGVGSPSYVVLSISMQNNKWAAVIGYEGKLYNVSVGDVLPADGSVVSSIDVENVVIEKDKQKKKLRIVSTI